MSNKIENLSVRGLEKNSRTGLDLETIRSAAPLNCRYGRCQCVHSIIRIRDTTLQMSSITYIVTLTL